MGHKTYFQQHMDNVYHILDIEDILKIIDDVILLAIANGLELDFQLP